MQSDLFGNAKEKFVCAFQKYGVWPMTVWPINMSDSATKQLKQEIGDIQTGDAYYGGLPNGKRKQARRNLTNQLMTIRKNLQPLQATGKNSCYGVKGESVHVSIFNPAIAAYLLNCYAPECGTCFDPFAGGGTRAIMAASYGLDYEGYEIRDEECLAVFDRCENAGVSDRVLIHCGDARNCKFTESESCDFLMTCPPYWNLEMYDGGANDLSMIPSYQEFLTEMEKVISETKRVLKRGAMSCWVVGLHRNTDGSLVCLNHDITRIHTSLGFKHKEEIVLNLVNNGAVQRVGNFEKGNKYLIRNHEYALVFER